MKITLDYQFKDGSDVKEWLDKGNRIKFVMIQFEQLIAHLFTNDLKHLGEAKRLLEENKDSKFVGAGDFRKDVDPRWDSDSCCDSFGYDEPKENPDQVIAEFKDALLKLIAEAPAKETPQLKSADTQVKFVPGPIEGDPILEILPIRSAEEQKEIDDWIKKSC